MARTPAPKDNPVDAEVNAATKAALEAGADPFGDDEPLEAETTEQRVAKVKTEQAEADGGAEDAADDEQLDGEGDTADKAKVEEEVAAPAAPEAAAPPAPDDGDVAEEEPEPRPYRGMSADDIKAKRTAAEAAIDDATEKMMDGAIEAKAFRVIEREQRAVLDSLVREEARAEARQDAINDYRQGVVQAIAQQARKQGIEYVADAKMTPEQQAVATRNAKRWDAAMNTLLATNDEGLSFRQLARQAHGMVLAMNGIAQAKRSAAAAPSPTAATPAPKPPARENGRPIATLRTVPPAATPNVGESLADAFRGKKGADFQRDFSKLTPAQRAKLLDE